MSILVILEIAAEAAVDNTEWVWSIMHYLNKQAKKNKKKQTTTEEDSQLTT